MNKALCDGVVEEIHLCVAVKLVMNKQVKKSKPDASKCCDETR